VLIRSHGQTDVGRVRQHNEDAFLIDEDLQLYLVCDGMGGHAAGDLASRTAVETVRRYLLERRDLLEEVKAGRRPPTEAGALLRHGIQAASARIHEMGLAERKQRGMGTTATALLILGEKGVMGHVGDSRLYLLRSGMVYQLSEDHTFVREAVRKGVMTPEQAAESVHANVVTRAVGPQPNVLVDTLVFDILPGDTLMLCSDGLHNYVHGSGELRHYLDVVELPSAVQQLIQQANERGGSDNITTVILRVEAAQAEANHHQARAEQVTSELATLGHIVLFRDLDMKELVKVANAFEDRWYEPGEVVVEEGEQSETLFVIAEGSVSVMRRGKELSVLRAGAHFGEMALLSRRPRSATVRCRRRTRLLTLDRLRFYALLKQDPLLSSKFLWKFAQTLSMRLDEFYLAADRDKAKGSRARSRDTKGYGTFPSPFDRRRGQTGE
jgi:serine/threonine protein phosphatase PrpC/CRP-like cAMP-binding protein